jgi:MtN3 and saliva related transmembrane protein
MSLSKPAVDVLGYCAAAMTTSALIPQLARVLRTHSAGDISLGMFSIYTCGVCCWLMYRLLAPARPVMIANSISLVLASSILCCKIYFDRAKHAS